MRISPKGLAALEQHEGVALRAYRDIVGVWTIGAGLTAASGVITPRAGMDITREEARALLDRALKRNYEPAVHAALLRLPDQHAFDAALGFHFNTGAIQRASWVRYWNKPCVDWSQVERRFKAWNKAGGRVVTGLENRRNEEFELLRHGIYPVPMTATPRGIANFTHSPSPAQLKHIRKSLARLGFDPGGNTAGVARAAVKKFQDSKGLRKDGIIGPATLHTLERARRGQSLFARIFRRS